jgi:protein-S-isoprenylcysteine O-methyltransferase Ste14
MLAVMSTVSNAIKTGLFTLFVPAIVAVGIPQSMLRERATGAVVPVLLRITGAVLFVLGVAGYFWCATLFVRAQGTPAPIFPTKSAVVSGPYRINRNPMYSSVLAVVFGQALFYRNWRLATYGATLAIFFHWFVVLYEERNLSRRFHGEYGEFCRRVPRWIPRLGAAARR